MIYDIAYTLNNKRDYEVFEKRKDALKRAKKLVKKGATKVYLDIFDNEDDMQLIAYKNITKG